jgi:RecB family exonuclease
MTVLGGQNLNIFFNAICDAACDENQILISDDELFFVAARVLCRNSSELSKVRNYIELLSELHRGGYFAKEILGMLGQPLRPSVDDVLYRLRDLEQVLLSDRRATDAMRRLFALRSLRAELPDSRALRALSIGSETLHVSSVFELSFVDIELLVTLAGYGLRVEVTLPIDEHARGLNAGLHQIATRFERRYDLSTLELRFVPLGNKSPGGDVANVLFSDEKLPARCRDQSHIVLAKDANSEAESVAKIVAAMGIGNGGHVAVVFGELGDKALSFKNAFEMHGFLVQGCPPKPMLETPAAQLLMHFFWCVDRFASSPRIKALLRHPALKHQAEQSEDALLHELKEQIPETATFAEFVALAISLADRHVEQQSLWRASSLTAYLHKLAGIGQTFILSRASFARVLEQLLKDEPVADAYAIEDQSLLSAGDKSVPPVVTLMGLGELQGQYDAVIFADMVHGRWPVLTDQTLIDDDDRAALNHAAGRAIFPMPFGDDAESSLLPAAFAKDALNLLVALQASKGHVAFSSSLKDLSGRDEVPSLFFRAAQNAAGLEPEHFVGIHTALHIEPNAIERRVFATEQSCFEDEQRALFKRAIDERNAFFSDQNNAPSQTPFAFFAGEDVVMKGFSEQLGFFAHKPLSPTRVEALAACRFRAFLTHFLNIHIEPERSRDTDARILGRLAHAVLESFFKLWSKSATSPYHFDAAAKELFASVFETEACVFAGEIHSGPPNVYRAHMEFLENALMRLISNTIEELSEKRSQVRAFETRFEAVPIAVGPHTLFFGGIVDRIDESDTTLSIVDYKLGSSDSIAMKSSRRALMQSHFQLPLYMRFVQNAWPGTGKKALEAKLVSIKDGGSGPVMGGESDIDMCLRIEDDSREDSLSAALLAVLGPLLGGSVDATPGAHCTSCHFKLMCRKPS